MALQPITVNLDGYNGYRTVVVQGDARYNGTRTSGSGCYGTSAEDYVVTIEGVECEGTWHGDGRRNVEVHHVPDPDLRRKLERLYRRREEEAKRRELARMSPSDRAYFE